MTQIDDILYSPISLSLDWRHLWADLDATNRRLLKALLGNLRYRYDTFRHYYPDPDMVDFTAKLTAYVFPRLLANHVVSVQAMADIRSSVVRLEWEDHGSGMRQTIKTHVVDSHLRNLSARVLPGDKDYPKYLSQIGDEIIIELDQDLLRVIRNLPDTPTAKNTFDVSAPITTMHPTTVSDEFAALMVMMNRESAHIAVKTRRGRGNRAIISPAALTVLDTAAGSAFIRDPEHKFYSATALPEKVKYCGILGNYMQVFVDEYADDTTPILISYKGDSSIDGGIVWAPYMAIDPLGRIVDPNTFELIQPFKTNRAYVVRVPKDDHDNVNASANWFGLVGFNPKATGWL